MKKRNYVTIGVTRAPNVLFCEGDTHNFDIYLTKHGFHLVAELKKPFDYDLARSRLRIGSKIDSSGKVVNPKPELVFCHCPKGKHNDKRLKGKPEFYITGSP